MAPNSVRPHVCAVKVGFGWVEDHAVDCGFVAVLEILDILLDVSRGVDGEDVAITSIIIEWVAVYSIRRLFGGKEEDGARFCVGIARFGCAVCQ
jgi:hypothetical protein